MDRKPNPNESMRPHDDYFLGWIRKMAAGASVEIGVSTEAVYLEILRKLSAEQIAEAGHRTIVEWTEPSKMPTLAFILERTEARSSDLQIVRETRDAPGGDPEYERLKAEADADPGYGQRIIDEMHKKFNLGAFTMPETKGEAVVDHRTAAEARARARNRRHDPDPGPDHPEERKAWVHRKHAEWYPEAYGSGGTTQTTPEAPNMPQRGSQGAKPGDWARGREPGEDG